ncbi:Gfo/Idh/MocA family oxidoreductase [Lentzea sp. NBRC 105346]|uniref:Gfo/Idh/MocA family protein n=1 Tax=Lentzea sp. NBRC 105346 TaxID=3032205 RepID=UPI002556F4C3|nr:Gfo/Idh/MocA family oxidoreductase [Lentzea sp. NBRC 105346]
MLNWGVIATGGIAHAVTADMRKVPGVNVHAVSSRILGKAEEFAAKHEIERPYGDYRALLADPDVDVVYVATPHAQHHEVTLAALRAGKHVLCEKAFTLTAAQAEDLVAVARSSGLFLMEAMWTRFNPLIRRLRSFDIGEIRTIRADFGFAHDFDPADRLWAKELGGGALLDLGVYPVSLAHMLLGEPETVTAHGSLAPTDVDGDAGLLLGYPHGAHALLTCSLRATSETKATIVGTHGRIDIADPFYNPTSIVVNGVEHTCPDGGYTHQIREVVERISAGDTESPEMPLDDSLAVMRTLEAALRQIGVDYLS